jgi:hypothetical protein
MSLEEQLHVAMKQRAMLAAVAVGTMGAPCVSEDSIRMKNATMKVIMRIFEEGDTFGDAIEKQLLLSSRDHCMEQIQINELLDNVF